jgi:LacI family transcriptional regulator
MLWPPLTTVHQPVRRLAAEALGLLVAEIAAAPSSEEHSDHVLDHEIVKRQSTAPLQAGEPA